MDASEQLKDDLRTGRIDTDRLVDLLAKLQRKLQAANERIEEQSKRIEELEKQLGGAAKKIDEPFSVRAEEQRQEARGKKKKRKRPPKKRRGRLKTADKIAQAERTEPVFPDGVDKSKCKLSHTRPVWRLENGRAALIAYQIYRGPKNQYGKIPGVLGRSEFGMEIVVEIAHLVYVIGLSFDKVCQLLSFFQDLQLRKSQADALLRQLSRHWEQEFDTLCILLANFTFVTAKPAEQPNGESQPVAGTNNEAERTLRGAAQARKTGRTSKTARGARRQTILTSVLESLRLYLATFTLSTVAQEIDRWLEAGQSCFAELLAKLNITTSHQSILDQVLPLPER